MPAIGAVFRKGREWVAWMGLVPHEHSTVGKLSLLDISKRGELVSATTVRTRRRRSLQYREKQSSVLPSHGSPASLAGNSLPSEWGRSAAHSILREFINSNFCASDFCATTTFRTVNSRMICWTRRWIALHKEKW